MTSAAGDDDRISPAWDAKDAARALRWLADTIERYALRVDRLRLVGGRLFAGRELPAGQRCYGEAVVAALSRLPRDLAVIALGRAESRPWWQLSAHLGASERSLRDRHGDALARLAAELAAGRVPNRFAAGRRERS